ncbi:Uncharacterised protein [Salmonella enterica subsp. enterica serovar Typhimurium str. DT104]|nr:Uncharacterised protein [Salmonella enterica subsp. enterica serovar Typhimurium str. DT104]
MNGNHDIANGVVQRRLYFRYPFIGNIKAEFEKDIVDIIKIIHKLQTMIIHCRNGF